MIDTKVNFDTKQFEAVFNEYKKFSKRDLPEINNRTMSDIFLLASQNAVVANKERIQNLQNQSWWPKFIAKYIKRNKRGTYTKSKAISASKALIRRRLRAVTYLKAGLLSVVSFFINKNYKKFSGIKTTVIKATQNNPSVTVSVNYKTNRTPELFENLIRNSFNTAISLKMKDWEGYIRKKLEKR